MAESDRTVLFSNETLLIGMLQAVSGGATVAAFAQAESIIDLIGYDAFRLFLTAMVVALLAAICAAYFKHQYKLWDQKAGASAAKGDEQEAEKRARKTGSYLNVIRALLVVALLCIAIGLVGLIVALWAGEPPGDDDSEHPVPQSLKV